MSKRDPSSKATKLIEKNISAIWRHTTNHEEEEEHKQKENCSNKNQSKNKRS